MKTLTAILVIVTLGTCIKVAQPQEVTPSLENSGARTQEFSLNLRWLHFKSQDLIFSPRIYRGSSLRMGELFYQSKSTRGLHKFSLSLGKVRMRPSDPITYLVNGTPTPTRPSIASLIDLQYGHAWRTSSGKKIEFSLGGIFESSFRYMDYRFGPNESDGSVISYSFAAWFITDMSLAPNQGLTFEVALPLLSWLGRSTISVTDEERLRASWELWHVTKNGRLAFPPNFVKLTAKVTYVRKLYRKADLLLSYRFEFLSYDIPLEINIMGNSVGTGISYHF